MHNSRIPFHKSFDIIYFFGYYHHFWVIYRCCGCCGGIRILALLGSDSDGNQKLAGHPQYLSAFYLPRQTLIRFALR
jgi:hypothetical protein